MQELTNECLALAKEGVLIIISTRRDAYLVLCNCELVYDPWSCRNCRNVSIFIFLESCKEVSKLSQKIGKAVQFSWFIERVIQTNYNNIKKGLFYKYIKFEYCVTLREWHWKSHWKNRVTLKIERIKDYE